jgi:nicotinamidase-related amidase
MKKLFTLLLLVLLSLPLLTCAQDKAAEKTKKMKPALIVIDIQNAFIPRMDQSNKESAMEMINYLIQLFREQGYPVIRVYHSAPEWGVKPDTEPFEYPSTVAITKDDPKVIKTYGDAFNKTDLDKILKEKGVNTLFLCGLSATGCVLSTYIGANNHDYQAFFIKDALLSPKAVHTQSIEDIFGAVSYEVVKVMLDNVQK